MRVAALAALALVPSVLLGTLTTAGAAYTTSTANSANAFTATTWCKPYTPYWLSGMEHGAASAAGGDASGGLFYLVEANGANTVTADSTMARSGNYSLKLVDTNGSGNARASVKYIDSPSVTVRFAVRFAALPASSLTELVTLFPSAPHYARLGYDSATNKLRAGWNTTYSNALSTVAAGRWYLIDLKVDTSANPWRFDWRIDGVAQTQITWAQPATTVGEVSFGSTQWPDNSSTWYDDMAITRTGADYPLQDGRILALNPNGVTAVNDASGRLDLDTGAAVTNGGALWSSLDDHPMTGTTDFMKQVGNDATAYAELGFEDTVRVGSCINGVSATLAYHSSNATGATGKTAIWDSGTERVVYTGAMNPGAAINYKSVGIQPATGFWTSTKLNAVTARIGYSPTATAANYAAWDALKLEYDAGPAANTAYQNEVQADSPVGYWRLGDTSGTTATATAGANGSYVNGTSLGYSSLVGDANASAYFDGTNDYTSLGDVNDFGGYAPFSVEVWMSRGTVGTAYRYLVDKESSSPSRNGWGLLLSDEWQVGARNKIMFDRWSGGAKDGVIGTTVTQPGVWYHVVGVFDGTTLYLYVNGVLEASWATARSLPGNAGPLTIGIGSDLGNIYDGAVDDVAVYPTALSLTRIQAHYTAGRR